MLGRSSQRLLAGYRDAVGYVGSLAELNSLDRFEWPEVKGTGSFAARFGREALMTAIRTRSRTCVTLEHRCGLIDTTRASKKWLIRHFLISCLHRPRSNEPSMLALEPDGGAASYMNVVT